MEIDEGSNQNSDVQPHWMAVHACLKNEFMEDKKCHKLMSWLISHPSQDTKRERNTNTKEMLPMSSAQQKPNQGKMSVDTASNVVRQANLCLRALQHDKF